jgi:hypothetical protein
MKKDRDRKRDSERERERERDRETLKGEGEGEGLGLGLGGGEGVAPFPSLLPEYSASARRLKRGTSSADPARGVPLPLALPPHTTSLHPTPRPSMRLCPARPGPARPGPSEPPAVT